MYLEIQSTSQTSDFVHVNRLCHRWWWAIAISYRRWRYKIYYNMYSFWIMKWYKESLLYEWKLRLCMLAGTWCACSSVVADCDNVTFIMVLEDFVHKVTFIMIVEDFVHKVIFIIIYASIHVSVILYKVVDLFVYLKHRWLHPPIWVHGLSYTDFR
jgi:hypothetical protein